ncbi:MAG: amino acid ABC transporter permease [Clostridia bacterium]|nr:amino acid ABC transporter permease [Clostridia bacterium]
MRDFKISKKVLWILIAALSVSLIFSFAVPAFAAAAESVPQDAGIVDIVKEAFLEIKHDIYSVLIQNDNYKHITDGLGVTIEITIAALFIGLALGFIVAIIRSTHDKTGKFKLLDSICKLYLTVFRGTPVIVQLLIIYYLWLGKMGIHENIAAIIAFGVNSGAYVAEILRSGIMSIDNGQFEAGRSLGFNYFKTMIYIVLPQAFKNTLPTLANEFIVLLKETSVASFIAVKDMMKGANALVGFTYNMNVPYITVALIYLVMVLVLQKGVSILERRLRNSDH